MIKVALLHWMTIPLNISNPGGAVRVELSELENHKKVGISSYLFGVNIIGEHSKIKKLRQYTLFGNKAVFIANLEFILRNLNTNILHGINTPILGVLAPHKSLVHFVNSPRDFHHPTCLWAQKHYAKARFAFCSEYNRQEFLKLCPYVPDNHVHTLHDGVDVNLFTPREEKRTGQKIKLFFIGNWCEEKGVHFLLDAVKILEDRRKDFELYLAGSVGYWKTDPDKARKYETLINSKLTGMKSVQLMGSLKYEVYANILKEMDVFVNPAIWEEPFPLVNLEAASCGLPIVSNAVGGIPELVRDGVNGYLVKERNPSAFAAAIERLLDNKEKIEVFGKRGREIVLNEFCWERHTEKLLKIYKEILNK